MRNFFVWLERNEKALYAVVLTVVGLTAIVMPAVIIPLINPIP